MEWKRTLAALVLVLGVGPPALAQTIDCSEKKLNPGGKPALCTYTDTGQLSDPIDAIACGTVTISHYAGSAGTGTATVYNCPAYQTTTSGCETLTTFSATDLDGDVFRPNPGHLLVESTADPNANAFISIKCGQEVGGGSGSGGFAGFAAECAADPSFPACGILSAGDGMVPTATERTGWTLSDNAIVVYAAQDCAGIGIDEADSCYTDLQDACDALEAKMTTAADDGYLLIHPGTYTNTANPLACHGDSTTAKIHLLGMGHGGILGQSGVDILPAADSTASATLRMSNASLSNVTVQLGTDSGDTGILIRGATGASEAIGNNTLNGVYVSGASSGAQTYATARGIEIISDNAGAVTNFVSIADSTVIIAPDSGATAIYLIYQDTEPAATIDEVLVSNSFIERGGSLSAAADGLAAFKLVEGFRFQAWQTQTYVGVNGNVFEVNENDVREVNWAGMSYRAESQARRTWNVLTNAGGTNVILNGTDISGLPLSRQAVLNVSGAATVNWRGDCSTMLHAAFDPNEAASEVADFYARDVTTGVALTDALASEANLWGFVAPRPSRIFKLHADTIGANPSPGNWTATVRVANSADTAVTCNIGAATSNCDSVTYDEVPTPAALIAKLVPAASPAATGAMWISVCLGI